MAKRYELTEAQFASIRDILPGKAGDPGRTAQDNHRFLNGVMWVLRSGAHWHDLPERYGNWKSTHKRFSRWAKNGVWEAVFTRLLKDPRNDYVMIDSTLVKAHQQAATGKKGAGEQALGRSRGGLTTKIHMLCDALGRPLRLLLTGGEKADCQSAPALLAGQTAKALIADKGYDTDAIRLLARAKRMKAVIPAKCNRKHQYRHDKTLYAERNRIERCFGRLKLHRRIATRFDRNDSHFRGFLYLACSLFWLN